MGCDIHAFVEYKRPDYDRWVSFGSQFHLDRNYTVFGKLAGVRRDGAVVEPRGLPDDLGWSAQDDYYLFISDTDSEGYVTAERAKYYVEKCGSVYRMLPNGEKPGWVSDPDAHTPSWLTLAEFEAAINGLEWTDEYQAIAAAMRLLDSKGNATRFVFWFDN